MVAAYVHGTSTRDIGPITEALMGEHVSRSTGAFPHRASALRLVTAVALNVTAIWTDRRYLDMALIKTKSETQTKAALDFIRWLRDEKQEFPQGGWASKYLSEANGDHREAIRTLLD